MPGPFESKSQLVNAIRKTGESKTKNTREIAELADRLEDSTPATWPDAAPVPEDVDAPKTEDDQ